VKITGISPIYNTISAGYPFLECLLLVLPIVDKMLVNDGGSTDGTREALEKFEKKFDKAEIIDIPHYESSSYESMDRALEEIIEMIDGGWIYEVQADEYIVDGENLKEEIKGADNLPEKKQRCVVYSRVVGYLSPIRQWNKGKSEEWKDRQEYDVDVKEG
jgi:ribonucleoside-triphosphate reductase